MFRLHFPRRRRRRLSNISRMIKVQISFEFCDLAKWQQRCKEQQQREICFFFFFYFRIDKGVMMIESCPKSVGRSSRYISHSRAIEIVVAMNLGAKIQNTHSLAPVRHTFDHGTTDLSCKTNILTHFTGQLMGNSVQRRRRSTLTPVSTQSEVNIFGLV